MARERFVSVSVVVLSFLMLVPTATLAQSVIAGVVKDTTGLTTHEWLCT